MKTFGIVAAIAIVLAAWFMWPSRYVYPLFTSTNAAPASSATGSAQVTISESPRVGDSYGAPMLGEKILRGYGDPAQPPANDLTLLSRLMDNSLLVMKSAANRPLSANEDWANFLRGQNSAHERFLPDNHPALNAQGQLVDRWGTPIFFHAVGGGRFEVRSAGPDRKLWTDDDLHRNADGSFRRGAELNPSSLVTPLRN
jgi:hypothetical protein